MNGNGQECILVHAKIPANCTDNKFGVPCSFFVCCGYIFCFGQPKLFLASQSLTISVAKLNKLMQSFRKSIPVEAVYFVLCVFDVRLAY